MKIKAGVFFTLATSMSLLIGIVYSQNKYKDIDFDVSMQAEKYRSTIGKSQTLVQWYSALKELYQRNNPQNIEMSCQLKIPKIIHQVWLGGPFPEEYKQFGSTWVQQHSAWQFVLWTDHPEVYPGVPCARSFEELQVMLNGDVMQRQQAMIVDVRNLQYDNKPFFDASKNYGERSDILKWELVYRFGGMYVDTDFECVRPLDDLHYQYDFYTGIQPLDTDCVQLGAALYAARPGHPILKKCVEGVKDNQHIPQIVVKTGPIHFTKSFLQTAGQNGSIDVALPASYFYPRAYNDLFEMREVWLCAESYAVHHWAGSWLKPEGTVH